MDIISAAQMALGYCVDIENTMCDRQAIIELGGLLGDYNEHPEPEVAIVDGDGYAIQSADPNAARDAADESVADCGNDPNKKAKGGRRRGDDDLPVEPVIQPAPEPAATPVEEPVVEQTAPVEPSVEPVFEPVVEELVPEEAPIEVAPAEPEQALEASTEQVVEPAETETSAGDLPGSIQYAVPAPAVGDDSGADEPDESEAEASDTGENRVAAIRVDNLTFLMAEDGLGLTGLLKVAGEGTDAVLADLRLAVSYRAADELPWQVVDESAACAFDSELPLTLSQGEASSVNLAFDCALSSPVPAGAAVRVRMEAVDSGGASAGREVAQGL